MKQQWPVAAYREAKESSPLFLTGAIHYLLYDRARQTSGKKVVSTKDGMNLRPSNVSIVA